MMKSLVACMLTLALSVVTVGCASSYVWRSNVPRSMRTVSVPTFRNDSTVQELGSLATRQVLRELQREGTFTIRPTGQAAVEVQGTIVAAYSGVSAYSRRAGLRLNAMQLTAIAQVSVVDKRNGRVLVQNRQYEVSVSYAAGSDTSTGERDASGRLADELAQQIVDDLLTLKWD